MSDKPIKAIRALQEDINTIQKQVSLLRNGLAFHINSAGAEIIEEVSFSLSRLRDDLTHYYMSLYHYENDLVNTLKKMRE